MVDMMSPPLLSEKRMRAPNESSLDLSHVAALAAIELGAAPCAVVAAAKRTGDEVRRGFGAAGRLWPREDAPTARIDTIFDLASVTKPITALALARLARRGELLREEPLEAVLPELASTRSARVPIDLFAAHRAGLDGHRPIYAPLVDGGEVDPREALVIAANARREGCEGDPPAGGFPPVYSDLGYLLLGASVAARAGEDPLDLDRVMAREVMDPLGLDVGSARQWRAKDPRFDERVAPTEIVPWRGAVRGAVHDENAWAIVKDAAAGHAGLFGDARSVLDLGLAVLDVLKGRAPSFLRPEDLEPHVRDRPGGSLLAGFDRKSGPNSSAGSRFGDRTFGHLGFTGTSLWIDPDAEIVGVLLTNRVHPTRETIAIRAARPAVYDALWEAIG
jgi:serine-type D-Ala-D-Ala carboxypeptidase